ncbi:MAG: ATP-dependent DNA ligase [Gammaproteobacteria bacterium]|nr:ATP-dependent DNA ligase [Gammaproteobacteria bacterium]
MKLHRLVGVSRSVAATRSRNAKRDALAEAIRAMAPDERAVGVAYLSGSLPQGRVGVGPAALQDSANVPASAAPTVSVTEVDEAIERVRNAAGPGSAAVKRDTLRGLFGRCVPEEQLFLVRLLVGEVRQGALDGVMVEAIALASGCSAAYVRHAHMLQGSLPRVADVAMTAGEPGLRRIRLSVGTPVQSMLAQTATEVGEAVAAMPSALLDTKMDGARVQVHKSGSDVAVFSRQHNDVSASVPEVVEAVAAMPASDLVLDGEVVAFDGNGRPLPFQTTMRRFGRRQNVAALRRDLPVQPYFFDCLHADGEDAIGSPLTERVGLLDTFVPGALHMPRMLTGDSTAARDFLQGALDAGHEGVMVKDPASAYAAGSRGKAWLKVKPAHTLDLVVLAAEWGHGRRQGWLSNLHLGARDPDGGGFVMLGKTFKGLTDEMLDWQTRALLDLEVSRDRYVVHVEPRLVVEILCNEVQTSPHYPAGLALRFARVKRYRPDKPATAADTLDAVRALHTGP